MNVKAGDPMPAAIAGDKVWEVVEATGETGLRGPDVQDQAHIKRSQFENGKVQVREFKAREEGKCFVYDGDVYVVTTDPARCAMGLALRLKSIDRQLRRLHSSICAPLAEEVVNSDPALRYLKRQLEAMMDNMELMRKSGFSPTSKRVRENANGG